MFLLRKDEVENHDHAMYSNTPPQLEGHPLFSRGTVGIVSAEKPKYLSAPGGTEGMKAELKNMGLNHTPSHGAYAGDRMSSFIVHNPTREQMYRLGRKFGQEAVVYSQDGKHELLYTHGPNAGKAHRSLPSVHFGETEPKDFHTHLPGVGYVGLHFGDQMHDTPVKWTMPLEHQATPNDMPLRKFAADLTEVLRKLVHKYGS